MREDGQYEIVLSRAEGHTFIWGMRAWHVIRYDMKKAMLELEDGLTMDEFDSIAEQASRLQRSYGYLS